MRVNYDGETVRIAELRDLLDERTPYGTVELAPTAPLAPFSQAAMDAADTLLIKAITRLRRGDREAAERLIARAADIPFDDHERSWPGVNMVPLQVYRVLADQSEVIADYHDLEDDFEDEPPLEIEIAIRSIRIDLSAVEGAALRYAIDELLTASDYHGIDSHQQKSIRKAQALLPAGEYNPDLGPESSPQQRIEMIEAGCRVAVLLLNSFDGY